MARLRRILRLLLPCLLLVANGWAQSSADEDVLLRTLQQQVDSLYHSFDKAVDPVYFLSVRVENCDDRHWLSAMGSDMGSTQERYARMSVLIRVGNGDLDNYSPLGDGFDEAYLESKVYDIPLDGNALAVSQVLSRATAEAYQQARVRYHQVLAARHDVSRLQTPQGDYVLEPSVAYYEPSLSPAIQDATIQQTLATATSALVRHEAYDCSADLHYQYVRHYLVTSEGTAIVQNSVRTSLNIVLTGLANDGTLLTLPKQYEMRLPEELPAGEELARDVQAQEKVLEQMRRSQVPTAAYCPVLFEDAAVATFWQYAFVPYLSQQTPPLQTQLAPVDWQAVSDPTISIYNNSTLLATYRYDDEGKEAERIRLMENGRLVAVPNASSNSRYFRLSNGHGRSLLDRCPSSVPANLIISCQKGLSEEGLYAKFKQTIAEQGVDFGYRVAFAVVDENSHSIRSVVAWKVYADNRPDEPVHGLELQGTPRQLLSQIGAGGTMARCVALSHNGVDYHCCAPDLLISQMEARPYPLEKGTPPKAILTFNPEKSTNDEDCAEVFFEAMHDDIQQALTTFAGKGATDVYYVNHLITDARHCSVESTMGSTVSSATRPVREVTTKVLVGDEHFNNDHMEGDVPVSTGLPLNNDYNHIRRLLRTQTDAAYQTAVRQYAEKEQVLLLLSDSARALLPSAQEHVQTKNLAFQSMYAQLEPNRLENLANAISSSFEGKTFLTGSRVSIDGFQGTAYFCGSNGVRYQQPVNVLRIRLEAEAQAADGTCLRDARERLYHDLSEIQDIASLQALAAEMAEDLRVWKSAPLVADDYKGPVLLEGEAVSEMALFALVEARPSLMATQALVPSLAQGNTRVSRAASLEHQIDNVLFSRAMDLEAHDSREYYEGVNLVGYSYLDADGVPTEERVEIVRRGELISLMGGNAFTTYGNNIRGHRRFALRGGHLQVASGPGVLEMSCHNTLSDKQLYKTLRKQARAAGMRYAYIVHKTIKEDGVCKPLYVSKMDVSTGKTTPVRLAKPLSFQLYDFIQLEAASKETSPVNRMVSPSFMGICDDSDSRLEGVPCSIILPHKILFQNINSLKYND